MMTRRMMTRRVPLLLTTIVMLTLSPAVRADTYNVDASHTAVIFSVSHLGYSYTYGRFNKCGGRFVLDGANSKFELAIDANSLDTNDTARDEHLRGADFFNVKQFPSITFQSTNVEQDGDSYNITGNLTMHGVTRQVTLPMKKLGEGKGPYGKFRLGFMSQFQIKRSDFGMKSMLEGIGDEVALSVSFEGIRQ
jgi:polyisoprenoid-binding protein YceI